MTIIAVDFETVAADGLAMTGEVISSLDAKKLRIVEVNGEQRIYAITGLFCMFDPVVDWIVNGALPKEIPNVPGSGPSGFEWWRVIEISRRGIRGFGSDQAYPEVLRAPFSMGCGRDYAMGAIWAGKTAPEAVALCCEHLPSIGGEIQVIDIMEVTGFTLPKRVPKEYGRSPAKLDIPGEIDYSKFR